MKLKFSFGIVLCLFVYAIKAQPIMSTNFETKISSYQEILDGIIVKSCVDSIGSDFGNLAFWDNGIISSEEKTEKGFPIGFDFVYNDVYMNQFAIGANFCIVLNNENVKLNPSTLYYNIGNDGNNIIGIPFTHELLGLPGTEISYKVCGETPRRCLVVQFKNIGLSDMWGEVCLKKVNFQIKLYETTNVIDFCFNDWKLDKNVYSMFFHIGLKGTIKNDLLSLSGIWNKPTLGNQIVNMSYNQENYPSDGLTYSFVPAEACDTPKNQPTELILDSSTTGISGTFKKSDADYYLVLLSKNKELTEFPVDGMRYAVNDTIGNSIVIDYTKDDSFATLEELKLVDASEYYIFVISSNALCSYGPKYNTQKPLISSVVTKPAQPRRLSVKENGFHSVSLDVQPNAAGDSVMVAMSVMCDKDANGNIIVDGKFGNPSCHLCVGDSLEGGGLLVYKGTGKPVTVLDLNENTLYHFKAWSIDSEGNISSIGVTDNVLTWGKVPYIPHFSDMPCLSAPFGWTLEGDDFLLDRDFVLTCNINQNASGSVNSLTSPWILLSETENRVLLDYNMQIPGRWGTAGTVYNDWDEKDLFAILVTNDEVNYDTIYCANSKTAIQQVSLDSYNRIYAPFEQYRGEKVKIKIFWKCYRGVRLKINYFEVEQKLPCDYPINLSASSIQGDKAIISWLSQGDECVWDLRYRVVEQDADKDIVFDWKLFENISSNPYVLNNLPNHKKIELQVRAKCSLSSIGNWSKSLYFTSGYGVPFVEDFKADKLPLGWDFKTGELGFPTEFCEGKNCHPQWEWLSSYRNKGVFMTANSLPAHEWLLMPVLDLGDGSVNYILKFNLKMLSKGLSEDETYHVVISVDGGDTYSGSDVIRTISKSELPDLNSEEVYTIPLNGFKGLIRPAIYVVSSKDKASYAQITQIAVEASCPTDVGNIQVTDIATDKASVIWDSDSDEWLVFIREKGSKKKEYEMVNFRKKDFKGLKAATTYEVGITKMCGVGDTARVSTCEFSTLTNIPCNMVEDIKVEISQYSSVISWKGDAMKYKVRFRTISSEAWNFKSTDECRILLDGLDASTTYEFGIQSICSDAVGDCSEFTENIQFRTLDITCFPPENISIEPTYKSAKVKWEGDADYYDLNIRKGTDDWRIIEVIGKKCMIDELDPETDYSIRVRSKCSVNDFSLWSPVVEFKTLAIPECTEPVNLSVSEITDSSALLSWDADESNLNWDVRYRIASSTNWLTKEDLLTKQCRLDSLQQNTAYIWAVKATCDEGRTSAWAVQNKFTTIVSSIDMEEKANLVRVFLSGNSLNVINERHCWIDYISVFDYSGTMLGSYKIDSDENVLIPMDFLPVQFLVKIQGSNWNETFPLLY